MYSIAMLLLSAADTVLLFWVLRECIRDGNAILWTLAFLIAALPYDTALVGLGSRIGQGEVLAALSAPRFMLFNLSLPLIIIVSAGIARRAGLAWLQPKWVMTLICTLAAGFIIAEWRSILTVPILYPSCWEDTLRYTLSVLPSQVCTEGQPGVGVKAALPLAAIVALPAVLVSAAAIWWRRGWSWMFIGAVTSFVILALPPSRVGPVPGFLGDAINMATLVAAAVRYRRAFPPVRSASPGAPGAF